MVRTEKKDTHALSDDASAKDDAVSEKSFTIRSRVIFATFFMLTIFGGVGGWAATAELSGAVIAPGSVVVDKNVKKLQHRDGGIVSKILAKNGDRVEAGEVIVELDDTQIKAELGVVQAQVIELTARKSRLSAETMKAEQIVFPDDFAGSSAHARLVSDGETRLFREMRTNLRSQKDQLNLQIDQLREEIKGIEAQRKAKGGQLEIMDRELAQITELYEKRLTSVTRLYSLQREAKRLRGEHGGLNAQIARANGKISEIKLQILSVEQSARLQAERDLRTVEAKLAELVERETAARDRLKRVKLLAPVSGLVHELAVHTIGGVITAAETVLVIVPENERLTIEARIAPVDIDQVAVGRKAKMHFSAFSQETTPELYGRIVHVSPDITKDEATSQSYYVGRVEVTEESKEKLKTMELLPGMPVEVFISTGARTALSYLSKPITDQFNRAFRED